MVIKWRPKIQSSFALVFLNKVTYHKPCSVTNEMSSKSLHFLDEKSVGWSY